MPMPQGMFSTVPITLLRTPGSPAPDWATTLRYKTFAFPGGNLAFTQIFGKSDWTVEYQVRIESQDDFQQLHALLGTRQMLRVPFGTTAYAGTRSLQFFGEIYKEFDRVFLTNISGVQLRRGGTVTCRCTFSREAQVPA